MRIREGLCPNGVKYCLVYMSKHESKNIEIQDKIKMLKNNYSSNFATFISGEASIKKVLDVIIQDEYKNTFKKG